jgi:transcriptional regulator with XRE-family HTH domain
MTWADGHFNADRLRAEREGLGLSIAALARKAGVLRRTVADAEAGRTIPYPTTVRKLARALGIEAGDLLGRRTRDTTGP